jgi:hypothetical protein
MAKRPSFKKNTKRRRREVDYAKLVAGANQVLDQIGSMLHNADISRAEGAVFHAGGENLYFILTETQQSLRWLQRVIGKEGTDK